MKSQILDLQQLKKFADDKHHQQTIWADVHSRISLFGLKSGQEIVTHTHHGSHIWFVVEGAGEFTTGGKTQTITTGQIVIVPAHEDHGIRNVGQENLVFTSITGQGD